MRSGLAAIVETAGSGGIVASDESVRVVALHAWGCMHQGYQAQTDGCAKRTQQL